MQEPLAITRLLNHLFGPMVVAVMQTIGIHSAHPATPFDNTFALEFLVACFLLAFFVLVRVTLSVENPNPAQQIAEMLHGFVGDQAEEVIGHDYARYQAFITCVFVFILLNNLVGLLIGFPGMDTPTSQPVVPLGIAVLAFLYYNFHGFREQGPIRYMKHFAGPVWWIAPLLFPVEIISHLARMMSLTIRLYANMLASDLLILISFSMIPVLLPTVFLGLHFFVSIIQAYVFMLLSTIYLAMSTAHEH